MEENEVEFSLISAVAVHVSKVKNLLKTVANQLELNLEWYLITLIRRTYFAST